MNKTTIEWTDYTWNPVTGCNKVSQGCKNCYAETMAKRFWGTRKFTDVYMHPERLNEPIEMGAKLHGKKVFVCDVSDLFHDDVPFDFIFNVFGIIRSCPNTIFQLLTKRLFRVIEFWHYQSDRFKRYGIECPILPNIWLGVSCEDQAAADERIPLLLQIPAAVRFLSCEPLIGPLFLPIKPFDIDSFPGIHWVIVGGESGRNARPMKAEWVRRIMKDCRAGDIPFFFKQWGEFVVFDQMPIELKRQLKNGDAKYSIKAFDDGDLIYHMHKVGKSKSGHMLDGIEYQQFPQSGSDQINESTN